VKDWRDRAACRGQDTDAFYREAPPDMPRADQKAAKAPALAFCSVCPVRPDCLEYALAKPEREGIWGGMTVSQRKKYAADRNRGAA
jgi:WhiB family redox-sensing transcriptional regulator